MQKHTYNIKYEVTSYSIQISLQISNGLSFIKNEILYNTVMYSTEHKSGYGHKGACLHLAKHSSTSLIQSCVA